jgi:ankyrin repeat protein
LCQLLIEKGAAVNHQVKSHYAPLLQAASNGHLEAVEVLVGAGADLNLENSKGFRARKLASLSRHSEVESFLAQHGALE